jgi:hypothetical protein
VSELKDIEDAHGKLTPELIVQSSKNKKSVLHSYFEWNNERAAEKWRLNQASRLLTQIEVTTINDGQPKVVRAFEIIRTANGYTNTAPEYSSSSSSSRLLISSCLADLRRVRNKLDGHSITEPISHIDKAIEALSKESTETKQEPAVLSAVG